MDSVEATSLSGVLTSTPTEDVNVASLSISHPFVETAVSALTSKPKTRSTNLTHEQKRLICLYAKQNPTYTQAQLGLWAKEQFGLASVPSQSSISHTLKRRHNFEHMKSEDWSSKRMRTVKYPDLDTALANWFLYCQSHQTRIQGDEIKQKAQSFFELMQLHTTDRDSPQFSNGWLHSFQSRHGFSRSPNTHNTEVEFLSTRAECIESVKGYAPWDVYWMDETRLHYGLHPDKAVMAEEQLESPLLQQLTMVLCANLDGSDLMDPFFISSSPLETLAAPGQPNTAEYGFTYAHNKKIWMTPTIFREWILAFDWKMHEENRSVLLILDQFSSHQVKKMTLKNVSIRFVAVPNITESCLAPIGNTIVTALKRRYRQCQLDYLVKCQDEGDSNTEIHPVQAIQWIIKCWRQLPKALSSMAFTKIGMLGDEEHVTELSSVDLVEDKLDNQIMNLVKRMKVKTPVTLSEFIYPFYEHVIDEDFTDQDFVDCALNASLSVTIPGFNSEPPRKLARIPRSKKTEFSIGTAPVSTYLNRGFSRGNGQARGTRGGRFNPDDPMSGPSSAIAEEEWQAWAESHRYRIDELYAFETVIRLAAEMNAEPSTLADLSRMHRELVQNRQPGQPATLQSSTELGTSGITNDGKQSTGICRFNFGGPSTTL